MSVISMGKDHIPDAVVLAQCSLVEAESVSQWQLMAESFSMRVLANGSLQLSLSLWIVPNLVCMR